MLGRHLLILQTGSQTGPSQRSLRLKGGPSLANAQVVAADVPVEIRQAAAVNFKNFVKFRWVRQLPPSKKLLWECMGAMCYNRLTNAQVPAQTEQAAISDAEKVRVPMYSMHVPFHACLHA